MIDEKSFQIICEKILLEINHGVILIDSTQKILLWNDWLCRHTKISAQQAVGKLIVNIFPEIEKNIRLHTGLQWCLESGKYTLISERFGLSPLNLYAENGVLMNPRIILGPIKFNEQFFCCMEIYDSSSYLAKEQFAREQAKKLKETQATLVETSRLVALGEMAGGIAHEINTPLGAIALRASQIKRMLGKKPVQLDKAIEFSDVIVSVCQRIESIIKGLRHFARCADKDPFIKTKILNIIRDTVLLCTVQLENHNIEIIIEGATEEMEIECRSVQISQVLLNLINNAQHAMNVCTEKKWIKVSCTDEEEFVCLRVIDNGPGVPESIAEKIFHPFFTTKNLAEGTGLGLSISRGIVGEHGGELALEQKMKNTTFLIKLPKAQTSAT
ncbi:MAG: ATP-binding protein [Bdellovibrionota bacterium]